MITEPGATDLHLDVAGEARLHRALRRCWQPVCRVDELAEKPVPVTLLDEPASSLPRARSGSASASRARSP